MLAAALTLASCVGSGSGSEQGSVEPEDEMKGMDASEMLMENGEYSDERFIDAMAPHHQGAVEMAEVALENAEHPELRQLAENVLSTQRAEIEELRSIKEEEFGDSELPTEMGSEEMETMGMTENPEELANQEPFDEAFIDEMIPHHESAIEMARVANEESDNPRIQDLSARIIEAQQREIEQMREWRQEWYPGASCSEAGKPLKEG
jgi:uncharacterized protein (DUF305 family)